MTDQIATSSSELSSLIAERAPGVGAPSDEASSTESPEATESDAEREEDRVAGPAALARDLPSRLAARMGGEHAAWTFADPSDAAAWAEAAAAFCTRFCPIDERCVGEECRLYRFEHAARAVIPA